jgi:transposase
MVRRSAARWRRSAALESGGLAALVPARPGPRRAHKLTDEVVDFARQQLEADPSLRSADLAQAIAERFGTRVHPRSVERALARSSFRPDRGGSR